MANPEMKPWTCPTGIQSWETEDPLVRKARGTSATLLSLGDGRTPAVREKNRRVAGHMNASPETWDFRDAPGINPWTGKCIRENSLHKRQYHKVNATSTMRITESHLDKPGNKACNVWLCPRFGEPGRAWVNKGRDEHSAVRIYSTGDLSAGHSRPATAP
jgi:hypothetical protein